MRPCEHDKANETETGVANGFFPASSKQIEFICDFPRIE